MAVAKRNPADATLRNVRANRKRDDQQSEAIAELRNAVTVLNMRVSDLERRKADRRQFAVK